jgi:hypothetical protein
MENQWIFKQTDCYLSGGIPNYTLVRFHRSVEENGSCDRAHITLASPC